MPMIENALGLSRNLEKVTTDVGIPRESRGAQILGKLQGSSIADNWEEPMS